MKKILSLALALVFMFALAIPAFADTVNATSGTFADKTSQVTATYTVSGTYTIEIPADFDLTVEGEATVATATKSVAVSNVLLPAGDVLTVTMTSANFDDETDKFYLVCDTNSKISYTIKNDGAAVDTNGATIISVSAGTKGGDTATLAFTANYTEAIYMGAHTDQLTFVASVD